MWRGTILRKKAAVKQRFLEGLSVWHWFLFGVISVFVGFTATLKDFTCIYR